MKPATDPKIQYPGESIVCDVFGLPPLSDLLRQPDPHRVRRAIRRRTSRVIDLRVKR